MGVFADEASVTSGYRDGKGGAANGGCV